MAEVATTSTFTGKLNRVNLLKRALFKLNCHRNSCIAYLKPKQVDTLYSVAENQDTISVLPTGYGKSIIFQILPYYSSLLNSYEAKIIVISPLNVIISEQADTSDTLVNVNTAFLSNLILDDGCFTQTDGKIFIGHPENILDKKFLKYIHVSKLESQVTHVVIDEAHCICLWGSNFRPKFRDIALLRSIVPSIIMVALTATATTETISEISSVLKFKNCSIITTSIDRPNVYIEICKRLPSSGKWENMAEKSIEECALPIIQDMIRKKSSFERTIIYTTLKGIGVIAELAVRLNEGEYPKEMAQYHAPQTSEVCQYVYINH